MAGPQDAQRPGRGRSWLTVQEAADVLGISTSTLRRWTAQGRVRERRTPGGHRRYEVNDIRAEVERRQAGRARVRPLDPPAGAIPGLAALIERDGAILAQEAARHLYVEGPEGWFASDLARPLVTRWLSGLVTGCRARDYAEADTPWLGLLDAAAVAGVPLLEVLRFSERFAQLVLSALTVPAEGLPARRLLTHQRHLLIAAADHSLEAPLSPVALREQLVGIANRFRALVFAEDAEQRIVDVNAQVCELLGFTRAALIGRSFLSLVATHKVHEATELQERMRTDEDVKGDFCLIDVTGSTRVVSLRGLVVPGTPGMLKIGSDVSEIRRDRNSAEWLAAIFNGSSDAIIAAEHGIITAWNPGAERIYGYTAEEAVGQPLTIVAPGEMSIEVREMHRRSLSGEPILDHRTSRLTKDGRTIAVVITVVPVIDADGVVRASTSITRVEPE